DDGGGEHTWAGSITNSYFLANPSVETGVTGFILTAQYANTQISGNIFQYTGARSDAYAVGFTEAGPNNRTITLENNIILPDPTGSMVLANLTSNSSVTWTDYADIEHNTIVVNGTSAINDGITVGTKSGTVLSLESNLVYNSGSSTGAYLF